MAKVCYTPKTFREKALTMIRQVNVILNEYAKQGYDLTLRQLYYQLVSRDLLPNTQKDYKQLGQLVNDARLAGLIDWDHIVDRTRNLKSLGHWSDPQDIINSCALSYRIDRWARQRTRVECWIEKEALAGVVERPCEALDIPFFSCKGYTSQSELWGAAQRHLGYMKAGQRPVVLHLGDHDPSGIDMTRDIQDRLRLFTTQDWYSAFMKRITGSGGGVTQGDVWKDMQDHCGCEGPQVIRLALNMDQVEEYNPPPNPAKATDVRFAKYQEEYGNQSWELDALNPTVIGQLITEAAESLLDREKWDEDLDREKVEREDLKLASRRWPAVTGFLHG